MARPRGPIAAALTCPDCESIYTEPHTIVECLHTFCRGCLDSRWHVGILQPKGRPPNVCPLCPHVVVGPDPYKSRKVLFDPTLTNLVAKLFPEQRDSRAIDQRRRAREEAESQGKKERLRKRPTLPAHVSAVAASGGDPPPAGVFGEGEEPGPSEAVPETAAAVALPPAKRVKAEDLGVASPPPPLPPPRPPPLPQEEEPPVFVLTTAPAAVAAVEEGFRPPDARNGDSERAGGQGEAEGKGDAEAQTLAERNYPQEEATVTPDAGEGTGMAKTTEMLKGSGTAEPPRTVEAPRAVEVPGTMEAPQAKDKSPRPEKAAVAPGAKGGVLEGAPTPAVLPVQAPVPVSTRPLSQRKRGPTIVQPAAVPKVSFALHPHPGSCLPALQKPFLEVKSSLTVGDIARYVAKKIPAVPDLNTRLHLSAVLQGPALPADFVLRDLPWPAPTAAAEGTPASIVTNSVLRYRLDTEIGEAGAPLPTERASPAPEAAP